MKKQSVAKQVLNLLNTKGGRKPKQIIAETKASAGSVYNALNQLRSRKMVAKEEDGVYISQTQTSTTPVSKPTNKDNTIDSKITLKYVQTLEKDINELTEWTHMWKRKYDVLERDYTQAKTMFLNSQAVVAYLEEKVVQLIRG
jgi:hypothetical protein